jgi:hypothetical protein
MTTAPARISRARATLIASRLQPDRAVMGFADFDDPGPGKRNHANTNITSPTTRQYQAAHIGVAAVLKVIVVWEAGIYSTVKPGLKLASIGAAVGAAANMISRGP